MKNKMICLGILFLVMPATSFALDQKMPKALVSGELAQGLSELRNSVEQMAVSNESLALRNLQLKERLTSAQMALQKLNQENEELSSAKLKLETPILARTKQIEELEKSSLALDQRMNDLRELLKANQERLTSAEQEEAQLSEQMKRIEDSSVVEEDLLSPELAEIRQQRQKEKLAVLKVISESQAQQVLLQEQLLDVQKDVPMSQEAQNVHRKSILESEIKYLEQETTQLNELRDHLANGGAGLKEEDLRSLEKSVADLEANKNELKDLVVKAQKKAQKIHLTSEQRNEQSKLQYNVEKLKEESKGLRLDLEEAEQQMVELDKKKTMLEILLQKS